MTPSELATVTFDYLMSNSDSEGSVPIALDAPSLVGTVQDDAFDRWVGDTLEAGLDGVDVYHSGKLTTPDLVLRCKDSGSMLGLEVKKLIQKTNGADPRGLTMDFNSCVPCGKALVRVGNDLAEIPCFYLFALLNPESTGTVTLLVMDGDFLNYDFDLHKEAKTANTSSYGHGAYGEGSVRGRAMYNYPNPLNHKLEEFYAKNLLVVKRVEVGSLGRSAASILDINRDDIHGNRFTYSCVTSTDQSTPSTILEVDDIFAACKNRQGKERVAAIPTLPPM